MDSCWVCQEIRDNPQNPAYVYRKNRKILITKHFVVYPALLCFTRGYIVIVPKEHYTSLSELPVTYYSELEKILKFLNDKLGHIIVFEHGEKSKTIEHAHLNVVPQTYKCFHRIYNYLLSDPHYHLLSSKNALSKILCYAKCTDKDYIVLGFYSKEIKEFHLFSEHITKPKLILRLICELCLNRELTDNPSDYVRNIEETYSLFK